MRTTLDIDDDILQAAKELGRLEKKTAGQVLSELAGSRRFYDLSEATAELDQALEGQEPQRRAQGVHILGTIDDPRATRRLIDFLDDPEDAVRLEAALAVERQVQRGLPKELAELVCRQMAARSSDSIERVRQAAMVVLGRLDSVDARQALVGGLADASRQIRSIAVEALVQIGTGAVPFVHAQLDSNDPHVRKMAAVILSRVNRREFGGLITASITGNLLAIYTNVGRLEALEGCNTYPSAAVLRSAGECLTIIAFGDLVAPELAVGETEISEDVGVCAEGRLGVLERGDGGLVPAFVDQPDRDQIGRVTQFGAFKQQARPRLDLGLGTTTQSGGNLRHRLVQGRGLWAFGCASCLVGLELRQFRLGLGSVPELDQSDGEVLPRRDQILIGLRGPLEKLCRALEIVETGGGEAGKVIAVGVARSNFQNPSKRFLGVREPGGFERLDAFAIFSSRVEARCAGTRRLSAAAHAATTAARIGVGRRRQKRGADQDNQGNAHRESPVSRSGGPIYQSGRRGTMKACNIGARQ